jgi:hypothetical protein
MIDSAIQSDLLREVSQLSPPQQRKVVEYAHSLVTSRPRGTPGRQLLKFAGTISPEDAEAMMAAIEDGCEQVEPDEW